MCRQCVLDPDNMTGPCLSCKAVTETALRRPICLRKKVTDTKLFDKGAHPQFQWTQRWKEMAFIEITKWASTEIKTISVMQDVGRLCYKLRVREFIPQPSDSLQRKWTSNGISHSYDCTNYAIENMQQAAQEHVNFVDQSIKQSVDYYIDKSDRLIHDTYKMALKYPMEQIVGAFIFQYSPGMNLLIPSF